MRITKRQLKRIIREEHQGYDAREDESLAAEHGPESEHEQDYEDRRDDAEFPAVGPAAPSGYGLVSVFSGSENHHDPSTGASSRKGR